jgi:hypothetical protein
MRILEFVFEVLECRFWDLDSIFAEVEAQINKKAVFGVLWP